MELQKRHGAAKTAWSYKNDMRHKITKKHTNNMEHRRERDMKMIQSAGVMWDTRMMQKVGVMFSFVLVYLGLAIFKFIVTCLSF